MRAARPTRTRIGGSRRRIGLVGFLSVAATAAVAFIGVPQFAYATGGATWDDVIAAQGDVVRQQQLIGEIESQITGLDAEVAAANDRAEKAGAAYGTASEKADGKRGEVMLLQQQSTDAQSRATESERQAGLLAAAMASRGAGDPQLALFSDPGRADQLLYQFGTISKLSEQTNGIYNDAVADKNTADSLESQASSAYDELQQLEAQAKSAYDTATTEQGAAYAAKAAADTRRSELQAMLIPLRAHRDVVASDYAQSEVIRANGVQTEQQQRVDAAWQEQLDSYAEAVARAIQTGTPPPPAPVKPPAPPQQPQPNTNTGQQPVPPATTAPPAQVPPPTTAAPVPSPAPVETTQPPVQPSTPSPSQQPSTPASPTAEPTTAPTTEPSVVPEPTPAPTPTPEPTTEPRPTTPPIDVVPDKPDIEVVPDPEPTPTPTPDPGPGNGGVLDGYAAPLDGAIITDVYGMRVNPVDGVYRMHWGLDLALNGGTCGAWLKAVHDGTVTFAGPSGGYGNHVEIDIGGGVTVSYSHIMPGGINVSVGQHVNPGDVIAFAGTTGNSTGCHLHFEVLYFGTNMDPLPWLEALGIHYS